VSVPLYVWMGVGDKTGVCMCLCELMSASIHRVGGVVVFKV